MTRCCFCIYFRFLIDTHFICRRNMKKESEFLTTIESSSDGVLYRRRLAALVSPSFTFKQFSSFLWISFESQAVAETFLHLFFFFSYLFFEKKNCDDEEEHQQVFLHTLEGKMRRNLLQISTSNQRQQKKRQKRKKKYFNFYSLIRYKNHSSFIET